MRAECAAYDARAAPVTGHRLTGIRVLLVDEAAEGRKMFAEWLSSIEPDTLISTIAGVAGPSAART